jgi:hypothetical protein
LYAPLGSATNASGRELTLELPDRTISVELLGAEARQIVADTDAFLARERPMLEWREYRRRPMWLLGIALIFALGLAIGPMMMSQTTEVDDKTGYKIAGGFAGMGLLANIAVVLFTRISIPGKVTVMATIAGAITGVFLLTTIAYIAGRNRGVEQPRLPEPGPSIPPPKPPDPVPETPPTPPRKMLPTAVDAARKEGVFQFEDGPDDVTALAVTPDNAVMMVGYKNGITKVWPFDHITVDTFALGPRADGPITHIQFDGSGAVSYLTCSGGAIAAFWNNPPEVPLKIPGDPFAVFSFPGEERFAVVRGNTIAVRGVSPRVFMEPPKAVKGAAILPSAPKSETTFNPPGRPQLLAWHPTGALLAALPDGSIFGWSGTERRPDVIVRDHKAAVRACATSPSSGNFATGDDRGIVGLWANKSVTPKIFTATSSTGAPVSITRLSFSPSGSYLAVSDSLNTIWVWNLVKMRTIVRTKRPEPVGAMCFGPHDDLLMLGNGKAVELWHMPELAKQP